jgi:2-methylaconitate cis-trans-isomerase PrpF
LAQKKEKQLMHIDLRLKDIMSQAATISVADCYTAPNVSRIHEIIHFPARNSIPAVWMRAGTSKGLFIHRKDLPTDRELWGQILISAMGSSQGGSRQVDGVGGATSTTSKVAVVAKSNRPDTDVEYTFIQVAPDQMKVDATGNCGNIASGVGPFALDEGLVKAHPGQAVVGKNPRAKVHGC